MRKLKNYVTALHKKTKRNYIHRMTDNKIFCMEVAQRYSRDYWDGNRRFGMEVISILRADGKNGPQIDKRL